LQSNWSNRAYDDVTYAHDDVTHDHFAEQLAKQLGLPEVEAVKLVKAIKVCALCL